MAQKEKIVLWGKSNFSLIDDHSNQIYADLC